ncbi:MAG TPA: hypothetical protein VG870_12460 [Chitinophagaceae bacterium]|nr:hypothetical protein [Chitinophagaceae bacterium]
MKSILVSLAAFLVLSGLTSCYKDIISPGQDPNGPPQQVSFSGDLVPIFSANCALSGCHDGTSHNPSLVAKDAYNALTGGGYVNVTVPTTSIIYSEVKSGSMPPTGALKASDTQKILDWIRNGAPNN